MSVRVIYKDVAVGADTDAAVTATGQTDYSAIALLPFGSYNDKVYSLLELNTWALDGTRVLYDGGVVSFWSEELSGGDCSFTAPPVITVEFSKRHTSLGVSLVFGEYNYCSEVQLTWYQDGSVLVDKTFYPNANEYYCEQTVTGYDKVVIQLKRTNMPYTRARLDAVFFGITRIFKRDELRGVRVTLEADPTSQEMAENMLEWHLSSKKTIEYIFQRRQPVEAYSGETLIGAFFITESTRTAERLYSVNCTDAIGVLDEDTFPEAIYTDKNALELAQEICSGFTVEMEEALQSKSVSGILKDRTRREALQQLCFALGAVADTSGTHSIKIFVPPRESPKEIGEDRIRTGGSMTKEAIVTAVKLTAHSYSMSGDGNTVKINGVTYYDTQTVTTIENPDVSITDKTNVLEITDATLISPANAAEIAQRIYDYVHLKTIQQLTFRVGSEFVGEYVTTVLPWRDGFTGTLKKMNITLSGIAVASAEVIAV